METIFQIRVEKDKKSHLIILPKNASIDDLYRAVAERLAPAHKHEELVLLFGDEILKYNEGKTLSDCHMVHLSTVVFGFRVVGGVWTLEEIEAKTRELVPLPGFITVTSSQSEPDMISFDDSPDKKRAKMPCGHVIGPESMTQYCQSLLSEGLYKFHCPSVKPVCEKEWEYFLVRHVACLTLEEMEEFEKKIASNYLQKSSGFQECPGCSSLCFRPEELRNSNCVRCVQCTKTKGVAFDFCWACLNEWKGSGSRGMCGNKDCDGKDKRLRILATCPTKVINNCKECPSIRGCPKCGMLIEHKEACGHMHCKSCKHDFCFICLEPKKGSNWPCSWSGNCVLAPRQTNLPGIL